MTLYAHTMPSFIGDYTLRVKNLEVVSRYYQSVIGLTPISLTPSRHVLGVDGVPLLTLNHYPDIAIASRRKTGLFHIAFLVPTRKDLSNFLKHLTNKRISIDGAADHLVSEALYMQDPEGNGIEVYVDRAYDEWTFDKDGVVMDTLPLNHNELRAIADKETQSTIASGTRIGHIHLKVDNLDTALSFYNIQLKQDVQETYPGAYFLAAGTYHHHIAINTWMSAGYKETNELTTGLESFTIIIKEKSLFNNIADHSLAESISDTQISIPTQWGYSVFINMIK